MMMMVVVVVMMMMMMMVAVMMMMMMVVHHVKRCINVPRFRKVQQSSTKFSLAGNLDWTRS